MNCVRNRKKEKGRKIEGKNVRDRNVNTIQQGDYKVKEESCPNILTKE